MVCKQFRKTLTKFVSSSKFLFLVSAMQPASFDGLSSPTV
jgi:hypothetical protein